MPILRSRRQQPSPVSPQVPIPGEFPSIPQEVLDRFPSAKDWQTRLNEFWGRTSQAIQEAQKQTATQVNSQVVFTVDRFLIYANGVPTPMFALDDTGVRLGNVLVINTPGRKVYIGAGTYANANTPFYVDFLGNFSLGDSFVWDADTDTLTITGIINATSGTIGGFDIGADYIRDTGNTFGLASTVTGGSDVRLWAGDTFANRATAPFRVTESGAMNVSSVVAGAFTIGSLSIASASGIISVSGGSSFISSTTGTILSLGGTVSGATTANGFLAQSTIGSGVTSLYRGFVSNPITDNAAFTLTNLRHFAAADVALLGASAVTNQIGFYVPAMSTGASNFGFFGNIVAGANQWNLYMAGTAANYFAGVSTFNLGLDAVSIGATTPGTGLFTTLGASGTITHSGGGMDFRMTSSAGIAIFGTISNTPLDIYANNGLAIAISTGQAIRLPNLAGVGTRNVVADASGNLTAP